MMMMGGQHLLQNDVSVQHLNEAQALEDAASSKASQEPLSRTQLKAQVNSVKEKVKNRFPSVVRNQGESTMSTEDPYGSGPLLGQAL